MNKSLITIFVVVLLAGGIYYVQKTGIVSFTNSGTGDNATLIQEISDRANAISAMLSRVQAIKLDTEFIKSQQFNSLIPLNAVILTPTNLGRENPFLEMPSKKIIEN